MSCRCITSFNFFFDFFCIGAPGPKGLDGFPGEIGPRGQIGPKGGIGVPG